MESNTHCGMEGNSLEYHEYSHLRSKSYVEPLPGSFPERQGKEHSKELCTLRMPRAGQTTHTEIHIYICEYVSRRLMAREEKQKRHSKGLEGKNRTLKTSKREGKRKTQ